MSTKAELLKLADETLKWKSRFGEQSPIALTLQKHVDVFKEFADRLDAVAVSDDRKQMIYALNRAKRMLEIEADKLHEKLDYGAQFPAADAGQIGKAIAALESILPIADETARYKEVAWFVSGPSDQTIVCKKDEIEKAVARLSKSNNDDPHDYTATAMYFKFVNDPAIDRAVASAKGDDK